jgi:ubiquinone/menaquinone biosynthesis C-methylase UbiE
MERPLERRTAARTAVVWDAVHAFLEGPERSGEQQVLDIGGGTGGFAVRVAGNGHRITVVDPSPDALAALARRADEQRVADLVTGVQGDLGNLRELAPEGGADLVLCHGVLGLVDDPAGALGTIASVLRPGGALSLVVSQRHAAVLARVMAGHFSQAAALLADERPDHASGAAGHPLGERRFTAEEVTGLLGDAGFTTTSVHGIRVFTDLVPSSLLDLEPGGSAALLELERAVATRPEYLTVASQLHVLATR